MMIDISCRCSRGFLVGYGSAGLLWLDASAGPAELHQTAGSTCSCKRPQPSPTGKAPSCPEETNSWLLAQHLQLGFSPFVGYLIQVQSIGDTSCGVWPVRGNPSLCNRCGHPRKPCLQLHNPALQPELTG